MRFLPDFVETDLESKSTEVTSSVRVSMAASVYHSRGRHWILAGSAIRALESFVRSIIRYGSFEMIVIWPGYFSSRRAWIRPRVPLPLFGVSMLLSISFEGIWIWIWIYGDYLPSNDNDLLLRL